MKPLYRIAKQLIVSLPTPPLLRWIPREENTAADDTANLVIDRELNGDDEEEDDEENQIEERGENFGFTRDELNILLNYGMKPWTSGFSECWNFIEAYKSGETDEGREPIWTRHLGSSTMWND